MKKLLLLGLSFVAIPVFVHAAEADITLAPNFLKYDGTYKFNLDVEGIVTPDKKWNIIVKDGKATLQPIKKGIKARKINIKDNVISVEIGALKGRDAQDLEVQALEGVLKGQLATMAPRKDTKKLTVDIGSGLTLQFFDAKRSKIGEHFSYQLKIGSDLPDGTYTCSLIRPPKGAKGDKTFTLEVKDHKIIKVSGNKEGRLVDGMLQIEATKMCATRRATIAGAIGGTAAAVILGTIATGGAMWAVAAPAGGAAAAGSIALSTTLVALQAGATAAEAAAAVTAVLATPAAAASIAAASVTAGTIAAIAGATGAATAEVAAISAAIAAEKASGETVVGAMFGFREMTLQVKCDSGTLAGKAVKIDYMECRKNIWELNSMDKKILITP